MSTKMLIDARHREETRVTIVKGNRVEEFDYESTAKLQLKGNIYLAKVTRVEPSLQAAFVDFGGNRHGFLPFSEIHPDYFQISDEDRQALDEDEQAYIERYERQMAAAESEAIELDEDDADDVEDKASPLAEDIVENDASVTIVGEDDMDDDDDDADTEADTEADTGADDEDEDASDESDDDSEALEADDEDENDDENDDDNEDDDEETSDNKKSGRRHNRPRRGRRGYRQNNRGNNRQQREPMDRETLINTARMRRLRNMKRQYKIQDVVKRNQIMLIQVVKEERGNKGAALTTYMSIAGRYSVLMPNTTHSGGISRKISNVRDRRHLKSIMSALKVPNGMGCIIRTAGIKRSKAEIKRDFDYLLRIWNSIREYTLKSIAPALIYEEGNLIKRSIRDLYDRNIDELLVEGERGFNIAKDFMKLLMPSHTGKVKHYKDRIPLFHRYQVENQLESMFNPVVTLKSGGYLVINPTEALIAIDVNSGKATREHNIEETALATNLEAAEEIGRQLKLRDMAGLVVIDFIDMEDRSNIRQIERKIADALKNDRARVQVGRISQLGLMELSRQRLRPNLVEASTKACPHCEGTGRVRSVESSAIYLIRAIEEEGVRSRSSLLTIRVPTSICIYLLNNKRRHLTELEMRFGLRIELMPDDTVVMPNFEIERVALEKEVAPQTDFITQESIAPRDVEIVDDTNKDNAKDEDSSDKDDGDAEKAEEQPQKRRRRGRRGGRRRREQEQNNNQNDEQSPSDDQAEASAKADDKATEPAVKADASTSGDDAEKSEEKKPRRRGRRPAKKADDTIETESPAEKTADDTNADKKDAEADEKPKRRRGRPRKSETSDAKADDKPAEKAPQKAPESKSAAEEKPAPEATTAPAPSTAPTEKTAEADDKPKKKGWWQRALGK